MNSFIRSKAGVLTIAICLCVMAFVFYRVQMKRKARLEKEAMQAPAAPGAQPGQQQQAGAAVANNGNSAENATPPASSLTTAEENQRKLKDSMASDGYHRFDSKGHEDRTRSGHAITKRDTSSKPNSSGTETAAEPAPVETVQHSKVKLRLSGQSGQTGNIGAIGKQVVQDSMGAVGGAVSSASDKVAGAPKAAARPVRFVPYGRPIKCELVFTIDSTMEETPLIGLVVEPVYNNGKLVIQAGTEIHGIARPDRQRDRIFSGKDFFMIFPRESGRPNGRQLHVHGRVLDRIEPDANGMTWGITDGSYGLQGTVIRTNNEAEIKQFAATALGAIAASLQEKQGTAFGGEITKATPKNAALQGLASSMDLMTKKISEEIDRNGVFIRIPGGKQFYFYPEQTIDPDAADISTDVAKVQ